MDPTKLIRSSSLPARETPPATQRTPERHLAIMAGVLTLLLALLGCAAVNSNGRATSSPTVEAGQTPTTPHATESDDPSPTPIPTHALSPTPTPPHAPTATPAPVRPSVHEVAQTTTLYGGSTGPATATCPQGELALGGGWSAPPQGARVFAATLSGGAWAVSVVPLGHPATTAVTAYVECLRGVPGAAVTTYPQQFSVPASSFNGGTVGCNGGGVVVGWGFSFGPTSSIELTASHPEILGWTLEFVNHGGVELVGSLVAECLSNVNVGANRINSAGVNVLTGATGGNQVTCPLGTAAAGGFQYSSGGGGNLYLLHATSTGWQAAAYAVTTSIYFNVWAMCLYFQ